MTRKGIYGEGKEGRRMEKKGNNDMRGKALSKDSKYVCEQNSLSNKTRPIAISRVLCEQQPTDGLTDQPTDQPTDQQSGL